MPMWPTAALGFRNALDFVYCVYCASGAVNTLKGAGAVDAASLHGNCHNGLGSTQPSDPSFRIWAPFRSWLEEG